MNQFSEVGRRLQVQAREGMVVLLGERSEVGEGMVLGPGDLQPWVQA